jgi:hypothetical protein
MAIKINAGVDAQGNEIKVGRTESFFVPAVRTSRWRKL